MGRAVERKPGALAERLDLLFRARHTAGSSEPSYQEVADALTDAGGPSVGSAYLYMLRTGRRTNPRIELLHALARYFGVPTSYFLDDAAAEEIGGQLRLLAALRDSDVQRLALRSLGLSAGSRQAVVTMIEQLRKAEGLPNDDDEDLAQSEERR